jgi:molybdopterin converting factor small subunit
VKLQVKLFAVAKELAGSDAIDVELPEDCRLADVRRAITQSHPSLTHVLAHALFAVNAQYADDQTRIPTDADVAVIPPVSGG